MTIRFFGEGEALVGQLRDYMEARAGGIKAWTGALARVKGVAVDPGSEGSEGMWALHYLASDQLAASGREVLPVTLTNGMVVLAVLAPAKSVPAPAL